MDLDLHEYFLWEASGSARGKRIRIQGVKMRRNCYLKLYKNSFQCFRSVPVPYTSTDPNLGALLNFDPRSRSGDQILVPNLKQCEKIILLSVFLGIEIRPIFAAESYSN